MESCDLENYHLGSRPWENAFWKIPNTPVLKIPNTPVLKIPNKPVLKIPNTPVLKIPNTPVLKIPNKPVLKMPRLNFCMILFLRTKQLLITCNKKRFWYGGIQNAVES